METTDFDKIIQRSVEIRKLYHNLELQFHGNEWTIEEDALAFLTDAGLVGRNTMSQQGRWPKDYDKNELEYKLSECIWWLIVLAKRMDIDIKDELNKFLTNTEELLK